MCQCKDGKFPLGMSHQSLVPKMRARVGERAVPMVQNDIARKMAAFLQQKFPFQFQICSLTAYLPWASATVPKMTPPMK